MDIKIPFSPIKTYITRSRLIALRPLDGHCNKYLPEHTARLNKNILFLHLKFRSAFYGMKNADV